MALNSIAIALLTYKRPPWLERSLRSALMQNGVDEILIVDNAADETLRTWLSKHFPAVRYIAAPQNGGCEGRNIALRSSSADVVITIDDDVELLADSAQAVLELFRQDPMLACTDFSIRDSQGRVAARDWCHPRPISDASREFETYFILEGQCALRREAVLSVGGYPAEFFIYHEGLDLAYRLIDRGWRIVHYPSIAVIHHVAPDAARAERFYYCAVRNGIWIGYKYLPPVAAFADIFSHILKMTFFAARAGRFRPHLRGCKDAVVGFGRIVHRTPIGSAARSRIAEMRASRATFYSRVSRHLRERLA